MTRLPSGISTPSVTKEFAPIKQPSPTFAPLRITAFIPISEALTQNSAHYVKNAGLYNEHLEERSL